MNGYDYMTMIVFVALSYGLTQILGDSAIFFLLWLIVLPVAVAAAYSAITKRSFSRIPRLIGIGVVLLVEIFSTISLFAEGLSPNEWPLWANIVTVIVFIIVWGAIMYWCFALGSWIVLRKK